MGQNKKDAPWTHQICQVQTLGDREFPKDSVQADANKCPPQHHSTPAPQSAPQWVPKHDKQFKIHAQHHSKSTILLMMDDVITGSAVARAIAEIATASKGGSLTTTMFSSLLDGKEPSQNFKEKHVFAQ